MVDSDSSVTTLGLGKEPVASKPRQESDNDWQSIDLLLTQDEDSSEDEAGGASEDDDTSLGQPERKKYKKCAMGPANTKESTAASNTACAQRNPSTPPGGVPSDQSQSPNCHVKSKRSPQEKKSSHFFASPATRTLNILSQQSSQEDLRYDMSMLEKDATDVMLSMRDGPSNKPKPRSQKKETAISQSSSSENDGKYDRQEKAAPSKKKEKAVTVRASNKNPGAKNHDCNKTSNSTADRTENSDRPATNRFLTESSEEPADDQQARDLEDENNNHRQDQRKTTLRALAVKAEHAQNTSNATKSTAISKPEVFINKQEKSSGQISKELLISGERSHPQNTKQDLTGPHESRPQYRPQQQGELPTPPPRHHDKHESDIPPDTIDHTSYYIQHIIVDKAGGLGCIVAKATPPKSLMPLYTQEYCKIKEISETSVAYSYGFRVDDWFADPSGQKLVDYHDLVARCKSNKRPMQLYVARKKGSYSTKPPVRVNGKWKSDNNRHKFSTDNDNVSTDIDLNNEIEKVVQKVLEDSQQLQSAPPQISVTSKPPPKQAQKLSSKASKQPNASLLSTSTSATSSESKCKRSRSGPASSVKKNHPREATDAGNDDESENGKVQDDEDIDVELPNEDRVVPFCKLCNLQNDGSKKSKPKKRSVHHGLCPKNPGFRDSNADNILCKIIAGVNLGCHACAKAYEVGKSTIATGGTHSITCPWREEKVANNSKVTKKKKQPQGKKSRASASSTTSEKGKTAVVSTSGKGSPKKKKSHNSSPEDHEEQPNPSTLKAKSLNLSSVRDGKTGRFVKNKGNVPQDEEGPNESPTDNSNAKQPPQNRPQQKETEATRHPSQEQDRSNIGTSNKRSAVEAELDSLDAEIPQKRQQTNKVGSAQNGSTKVVTRPANAVETRKDSSNGARIPIPQMTPPPVYNTSTTRSTVSHQVTPAGCSTTPTLADDGGPCKSKWIRCDTNPWGPDGYMDGDVVLLTPASGIGHYETLLSSRRYEMDPFSEAAGYTTTHTFPEYNFLSLKRDPMAQRSWGFSITRHDFGGACLVSSVDPLSPAEAAVSL